MAGKDVISDRDLDNYYSRNYYGVGRDYFDPPEGDYDDIEEYDPEWDGWVKPSEREI